jgi:Ca2+:H+ antiporter
VLKPSLNWLLAFIPVAAYFEYVAHLPTWVFLTSCLSIIPIAGWMGDATEHLAEHTGEGIGGLLNATFGNAAELIIALVALSQATADNGMHDVVKASITGSIIGNILLVLGGACLAGGLRYKTLQFSGPAVRSYSSMLFIAAISLVLPAVFHYVGGKNLAARERDLSVEISVVMLVTYALSLVFSLKTHKNLFEGDATEHESPSELPQIAAPQESSPGVAVVEKEEVWSLKKSLGVLGVATVVIGVLAEWMVGSVTHAAEAFGMSSVFVGIIVVAIVGNAAEHSTALMAARKNRMDLALGVAIGSSIQIALFVAPVLVMASHFLGHDPMDLVFSPMEVIAVVVSVLIAEQITGDGETHWLEGVQLLSVYAVLALVFYALPDVVHTAAAAAH